MNKVKVLLVAGAILTAGLIFSIGKAAHADGLVCGLNTFNATYDTSSSTNPVLLTATSTVDQECSAGIPSELMNPWGLTGAQSKWIPSGTVIIDPSGFTINDACPKVIDGISGCYDISGTAYYAQKAKALALQLESNGQLLQFPWVRFWLNQ